MHEKSLLKSLATSLKLTVCISHREEESGGDLCKSDSDCGRQDPNTECRYDVVKGLRRCACKPFYVKGDSPLGPCVPGPDAGCDIKVRGMRMYI